MTIKHVFDVVVIGAGLSGLQAAHVVKAAGLTVCVLEATGRVGGKTLTMQSTERGFNDLGAAWINDTNQSEMFKLYQRYGMETEIQRACGNDVAQLTDGTVLKMPYGQPLVYYSFIISRNSSVRSDANFASREIPSYCKSYWSYSEPKGPKSIWITRGILQTPKTSIKLLFENSVLKG